MAGQFLVVYGGVNTGNVNDANKVGCHGNNTFAHDADAPGPTKLFPPRAPPPPAYKANPPPPIWQGHVLTFNLLACTPFKLPT